MVGVSRDGRYYLLQIDRFEGKNKLNDNARLVIWDNKEKNIYDEIQGKHLADYLSWNPILDIERKRVYYNQSEGVYCIDFEKNETLDLLEKNDIKPEAVDEFGNKQYYVDQIAYDKGNLFINISFRDDKGEEKHRLYWINDSGCREIVIDIENKIQFIRTLGAIDSDRLLLRINSKFYIVDYEGNILEERPLMDDEMFNSVGSSRMIASYDGKKILYNLGKTPLNLYVYDFESREIKKLCPAETGQDQPGEGVTEKYGRNIVKQVVEPVNTMWKGRASIFTK